MTSEELLREFASRKGYTVERRQAFADGADALGRLARAEKVLADGTEAFRELRQQVRLFRTKREAQTWREDTLRSGAYDLWKPKKVTVTDAT